MTTSEDPTPPPLPEPRQGPSGAGVLILGALLAVIAVLVVFGLKFLTDGGDDEESPFDALSSYRIELPDGTTTEVPHPEAPQGDSEGTLSVLPLEAIAPEPSEEWEEFRPFGSDWSPFTDIDTRSLPYTSDFIGFMGIGAVDEQAVPFEPGGEEAALQSIAEIISETFLTGLDGMELSELEFTAVELDGRSGMIGEFSLTWDDPVGLGDTRADYAVVIADLGEIGVFAGFMGLFASQEDDYDETLETLLAVDFLEESEPESGTTD